MPLSPLLFELLYVEYDPRERFQMAYLSKSLKYHFALCLKMVDKKMENFSANSGIEGER